MTSRWVLFVSARHFRTKRREKGHTAGILSVLGIAAGVMTLIAVMAVMNGFQFGTIEDILEVGSFHLQVTVPDRAVRQTAETIGELPGMRAVVPYAESYGLVYGYFPDPLAVLLRIVPPDLPQADERFGGNVEIVSGRWDLSTGGVVLGQELARRLGARVGDTVEILGFEGALTPGAARATELELVGIFRSGFLEYDAGWGFVGLGEAAARLGVDGPERVGVKLVNRFRDRMARRRVEALIGGASFVAEGRVEVESWRDYNRAIFGALRLEKIMMMLLVGLIFVVVAVNIYHSLRRSVIERTEEIGVLKALGAPPMPLQVVFVMEGLWIGLAGGALGLALGLLVSHNINALFRAAEVVVNALSYAGQWMVSLLSARGDATTGAFSIFSPAYFYIREVPAVVVPVEVAAIVLFAVLSATVAAYVASHRVSAIAPAEVLRYE